MNKWFNGETNHIDIPIDELNLAIDRGIAKARKKRKNRKITNMFVSIGSTAAALLLISGFLFAPMTKVLASVPVIGSIYEALHMNMGKSLEEKQLVTPLQQTVSYNGVEITLTSAYYDGTYVGITFEASGEELDHNAYEEDHHGYEFYLFEKDGVKTDWGGSLGVLQEMDGYYTSAFELEYPDRELPENFVLPIIFTSIGGVDGSWQFSVPVTQLPLISIVVESTSQDENYFLTMKSIAIGETNMRLEYTTSIPEDNLEFRIVDNKGHELSEDTLLRFGNESAVFETGIRKGTEFLTVTPMYRMDGELKELTPIRIQIKDQ